MATSRIFVKGLPPTFNDPEFRKHFAQKWEITDAKIFPNRRIGYIGYKTPEDAQKAVKYYNKTFIRMSRIGVELARPVQDGRSGSAPTARLGADGTSSMPAGGVSNVQANEEKAMKWKRPSESEEAQHPKLKEFLDAYKPKGKRKAWEVEESSTTVEPRPQATEDTTVAVEDQPSDEEYEEVPSKAKRLKRDSDSRKKDVVHEDVGEEPRTDREGVEEGIRFVEAPPEILHKEQNPATDADWARTRTSRLLGLLDDDEEDPTTGEQLEDDFPALSGDDAEPEKAASKTQHVNGAESSMPTPPSDNDSPEATVDAEGEAVRSSMRLFVRNLSYNVKEEDLEAEFAAFGDLEEVHLALDTKTGANKGFAFVQFTNPDAAETALREKDGQTFQGRLLHIIPALKKRETKLDDFALSKLPLKKQQLIKRRREATTSTFDWNALYMNADSVVSSVAERLGLSKSEVLDPTSSDAGVRQAHAETKVIQETKAYFQQQGVDLDSFKKFKKSQRGDTAILAKNIPYDCSRDELRRLFEEHGELKRFLTPPAGLIAIVEFANEAQCKTAYGALAYRKLKSSMLMLEKAPKGLFDGRGASGGIAIEADGVEKTSASDLKVSENIVSDTVGAATLFVRNLNFTTKSEELGKLFKTFEGFLSARVKTKTDPKKPGQVLSMGFGFLEFRTSQQAHAALKAMDGYTLDGHKLQIRASHKGADAASDRRRADAEKRIAGRKTKIIIKNFPFEATKKDVHSLFGAYGQLRSVRVPKKADRGARGFAFADFTTPKEAESAMSALRDTHLLGRRLVLDFAEEEPEDAEAEIQRMQVRIGEQVNRVKLRELTGRGRKRFSTMDGDEE